MVYKSFPEKTVHLQRLKFSTIVDAVIIYGIIILGVLGVGALFLTQKIVRESKYLQFINTFGGAFLLAICFLDLIPHIYDSHHVHEHSNTCLHHDISIALDKIGIFVLLGFLIQLLLEYLTKGVDHGHLHTHESPHNRWTNIIGLMTGVCMHAFLEGMPIMQASGHIQLGLVVGIVIHNIPIALILCGLFMETGYSAKKSLLLLLLFAVMTPLGSFVSRYLFVDLAGFEQVITAVVVGILLHVSVSILFQKEYDHKTSLFRLLSILAAFGLALLIPSCVH